MSKKGQAVKYITDEDIHRMLNYFLENESFVIYSIAVLCLHTGLRISDALCLKFEDLDKTSIIELKTNKQKEIVFNKKCLDSFELLKIFYRKKGYKEFDSGFLFKSQIKPKKAITYQGINIKMVKMKEDLAIDYPINTHSFRKTWGRRIYYQFGKDLALVMKALNHSNPRITLRYIGIDEDDLNNVYINVSFS